MNDNLDKLPCGYITFNDYGIITACNSTLATWLGYSKEELVGKSIENIFTLASRIFYNTHFFPLIKLHSKAHEIFLSLKQKNKQDLPVLANADRTLLEGEPVIHCVFIQLNERKKYEQEILIAKREAENALMENKQLLDITKSLEQHAIELEKQYRNQLTVTENLLQFSKIISHDLQEPIRKIQVFMDLILTDKNTVMSDEGMAYSLKIKGAAEKLKTLTRSLNQFITVDNKGNFTSVDLNAIIEEARITAINARQFEDFDMEVQKMPQIDGYKDQLTLLFYHLIDNSILYRLPKGRLSIKINAVVLQQNIFKISKERYKYTEHVKITFSDNGSGFGDQYKEYVFEMLKKIHTSGNGLGVGLPLVKKIINNHSGNISLESSPGNGTQIEIELPVRMPLNVN